MKPYQPGAEDLFSQALELPPEERARFLDQRCGNDPELRAEIESLLRWHDFADAESWDIPSQPDSQIAPALAQIRARTIRRVGAFELHQYIGEGATGIVYRAIDTRTGQTVALKIASPKTMLNPANRQRFERAAEAAMRIENARIARVLETGLVENMLYVALEYVDGRTLADELEARSFDPVAALLIARQIAEALDAAHRHGIIHRDLKPANIMIDAAGNVKVLDFGLCHALVGAESIVQTQSGVALGTLGYMAPEQARGETPTPQSDLFSFGSVLYEMLTGVRAFRGATPVAILSSILHDQPKRTARRSWLMDLALWCLEKDPARRPESAARVLAEIGRLEKGRTSIALRAKRLSRVLPKIGLAAVLVLVAVAGVRFSLRPPRAAPGSGDWVQLTRFPDSVSQPALSRDGRKLTFIRSSSTFAGAGQIYVKTLPDGAAIQITHDDLRKISPVFSPDASKIAYGTASSGNKWDTWIVPAAGGESSRWLVNTSGLVWFGRNKLLFSEIKDTNVHMAIVTSDENRNSARDVYVPVNVAAMAHRSFPSPDEQWVALVEMDPNGVFLPCRLVPMDGRSQGRLVGPQGPCTFAAWAPDGKWIYLTSAAGGAFHIWRQRFPDGTPEQVTSGVTEEEGIAMAPDGRSLITAVGLKQSSIWIRDSSGERQLGVEGYSYDPKFTPDGKKICYRVLHGSSPTTDPSEIQVLDLASNVSKPAFPGFIVTGGLGLVYDISPDGSEIVAAVADAKGKRHVALASIGGSLPPRVIPNLAGDQPLFDKNGDILVHSGVPSVLCRVSQNGEGLRKVMNEPMLPRGGISPDGRWLAVRVIRPAGYTTLLYPLNGGLPVEIAPSGALDYYLNWSRDGRAVILSIASSQSSDLGRSYLVPLKPGKFLPQIPPGGFRAETEIAQLPGAQLIGSLDAAPGPVPGIYAYARETLLRNLFRVGVP